MRCCGWLVDGLISLIPLTPLSFYLSRTRGWRPGGRRSQRCSPIGERVERGACVRPGSAAREHRATAAAFGRRVAVCRSHAGWQRPPTLGWWRRREWERRWQRRQPRRAGCRNKRIVVNTRGLVSPSFNNELVWERALIDPKRILL